MPGPKAVSVNQDGSEDGWAPSPGWFPEVTPQGDTRLTVSVPAQQLPSVHLALVEALAAPLSVLYRQKIDRQDPRPQGSPPRDFVAVDLGARGVLEALREASELIHGDARCELWIRGGMGEQLVLDEDGLLYLYPDDPAFRDVLVQVGVAEADVETILDRDYVKHWFHAACDPVEAALIAGLGLSEVPHR